MGAKIKNPWDDRLRDAMLAVLMATKEPFDVNRAEQLISGIPGTGKKGVCPACGKAMKYSVNLSKGFCRCAACGKANDPVGFYADYFGVSIPQAKKYISGALGYTDEKVSHKIDFSSVPDSKNEEVDIASPESLDKAYNILLDSTRLLDREKSMLLSRGFTAQEITSLGYKTFPGYKELDDSQMEGIINLLINWHGLNPMGIPGFYKNRAGKASIVRPEGTGIVMKQINRYGQVTGLQIRIDNQFLKEGENKCRWLSSPGRKEGCRVKTCVHYACEWQDGKPVHTGEVFLTEGIMKADLAHKIMPQIPFISIAGVNMIKAVENEVEFLKEIGVKKVVMCFDQDYLTNPNVQKALKDMVIMLVTKGMEVGKQLVWSTDSPGKKLKGIDDYFAYVCRGIC